MSINFNTLQSNEIVKWFYPDGEGTAWFELKNGDDYLFTKYSPCKDEQEAQDWFEEHFEDLPVDAEITEEETPWWTITTINNTDITRQDDYSPPCPFCGMESSGDESDEYNCGHFIGSYNDWFQEERLRSEIVHKAIDGTRIITSHVNAGQIEWFFAGNNPELDAIITPSEADQLFGLSEGTARMAAYRGSIPSRKSAGTFLIRREDAEKRWKKLPDLEIIYTSDLSGITHTGDITEDELEQYKSDWIDYLKSHFEAEYSKQYTVSFEWVDSASFTHWEFRCSQLSDDELETMADDMQYESDELFNEFNNQ